jgi:group I intron endonuclease
MREKIFCKLAVIYRYVLSDGRCYVGQTRDLARRRRNHSKYTNSDRTYFARAVCKYGFNAFTEEILEFFPEGADITVLNDAETKWIEHFKSYDPERGFNICKSGVGRLPTEEQIEKAASSHRGKKRSELTKRRISLSLKGKPSSQRGSKRSETTCKNISDALLGRHVSDETRVKISESLRGQPRPRNDEWQTKINESKRGVPLSEEHRRSISNTKLNVPLEESHKQKIAESLRGLNKSLTDEGRKALKESCAERNRSRKGISHSASHVLAISASLKGKKRPAMPEEQKQIMRVALKEYWARRKALEKVADTTDETQCCITEDSRNDR